MVRTVASAVVAVWVVEAVWSVAGGGWVVVGCGRGVEREEVNTLGIVSVHLMKRKRKGKEKLKKERERKLKK